MLVPNQGASRVPDRVLNRIPDQHRHRVPPRIVPYTSVRGRSRHLLPTSPARRYPFRGPPRSDPPPYAPSSTRSDMRDQTCARARVGPGPGRRGAGGLTTREQPTARPRHGRGREHGRGLPRSAPLGTRPPRDEDPRARAAHDARRDPQSPDGRQDNDARRGGGSALTEDTRAWTIARPPSSRDACAPPSA